MYLLNSRYLKVIKSGLAANNLENIVINAVAEEELKSINAQDYVIYA
jgi:hypothetical protein